MEAAARLPLSDLPPDDQAIEQIIGVEAGLRGLSGKGRGPQVGLTDPPLYIWRSNYGGMDVNEAKRQRSLEEESRRLK